MAKKEFKIKDLFGLQEEINEILSQKISISTRYKFSEIKKTVDDAVTLATETKNSYIKKYGTEDDKGNFNLRIFMDEEEKKVNPKFEEFIKEWNEILETNKEINFQPIKLEDIETIQTEKPINVLFSLLENKN